MKLYNIEKNTQKWEKTKNKTQHPGSLPLSRRRSCIAWSLSSVAKKRRCHILTSCVPNKPIWIFPPMLFFRASGVFMPRSLLDPRIWGGSRFSASPLACPSPCRAWGSFDGRKATCKSAGAPEGYVISHWNWKQQLPQCRAPETGVLC